MLESPPAKIRLAKVNGVVAAPMADIWAIVSDFARPQRLAPGVERCVVTGDGPGAVRIITSARGLCIHERLLECDAAAGRYRYEVLPDGDMPFAHVTSYQSTVTVRPIAARATEIEWSSVGTIDGPPEPIETFLTTLYERAIDRIRAALTTS